MTGQLDHETDQAHTLEVTVEDDGATPLNDTATITINIADLNEAPSISDQAFSVAENATNGTLVGTVMATDPDQTSPNNTLTYSITSDDENIVFAINQGNGEITATGQLDHETDPVHTLESRLKTAERHL